MSTMAASGSFLDASSSPPKPASPSSLATFTNQQPRSFMNLNSSTRAQVPPFPITPTSGHSSSYLEPPPGVAYSDFIRAWRDDHVARWLSDIKCGSHAASFKANDIRGDVILELDQVILQEMGISSIGDRLRIINAVKALRLKSTPRLAAPETPRPNRLNADLGGQAGATGLQDTFPGVRRIRPRPLDLGSSSNRNDLPHLEQPPDSAARNIRPPPTLRPNLPPVPPPPRGQPPSAPPARQPVRILNGSQHNTGRRTPTQSEPAPPYTTQALPPAPPNQNLLTAPPQITRPGYNSHTDPRSGPAGPSKPPARSTSPLIPNRGSTRPNPNNPAHSRNGSLGPGGSIPTNKLPPRPSTTNSHPYAKAQPALQPPSAQSYDLSPIAESFRTQYSSTTSGSPSPPSGYTVSRGPFNPNTPSHSNAPSLDDLRRKLVKFVLPDEGLSFTIDVATCAGGVEVLEKVLKKFGKGGSRSTDADGGMDHVQVDDGGLSVDGWGVYLDIGQEDGPGKPLTEAELLSMCHARPDHPAREHGLTLRRTAKTRRYDERNDSSSPANNRFLNIGKTDPQTKRASSISILSGLGVRDPEKALDPPSPTQSGRLSPAAQGAKRPSKLHNFFGHRPPSELITTHLTEYFPFTEKKVLERTARHSMMRSNTLSSMRRDSTSSWNPPPLSRFSGSTQGRSSISPTRNSFSSIVPPPHLPEKPFVDHEDNSNEASSNEDIPRVSLSTEDGRSVDLHDDNSRSSPAAFAQPRLLPPIPFPTESFSESLESITGGHLHSRPLSRAMSNSSRRMSYMTELRSKRDRSDTASLMTVDEITAEVESRRESTTLTRNSDPDWTKVEAEDSDTVGNTLTEEVDELDEPAEVEDDTLNDEADDEDDEPGVAVTSKGANKWIKGALIGAGSFGKVYLGMDASNGLLMAVKQVELPTGSAPNQERKKSMLNALEREIDLLKTLQHENIVQYLYSSIDDEYLNIFLEYVPGGSVTALLRNYGAFEETLVKNFVRQILEGLNYLHERDIIHRDIKGGNILVDNKGGIKISDFGISKKVDDNLLTGGNRAHRPSLQGSVFWMAPEVVKQTGHTRKADIWSVGCLVVEMLTGEHPWAQLTQMQAIFKIGSSAKPTIPSDISVEAQDFLQLTFELDHEARPSAAELLHHSWISKKPAPKGKPNAVIEVTV